MSTSKYVAFVRTVECKSLTRAAEQLGYTQSAVSHIINGLEEEFGFALLIRTRAGVQLTPDGARVLPLIREILNADERLLQTAAAIRGIEAGTVRIGTFTSVAVHWLPGMIKSFERDYPDVEFRLSNGDYYDVEKWLTEGSVDVGFLNLPVRPEFSCVPLFEDRILAVVPKGHRLSHEPCFPLSELENEPFISLLQASDHDVRHALAGTGVKLNVKYYTKDDYAIIAMVENGLGVSILPELVLSGREDGVCVLELENRARRTIGLATTQSAENMPAVRMFSLYARRWVEKNVKQ